MSQWHLRQSGLDPAMELARHERLARELRAKRATMKNRNNGTTRDLINRAIWHEEQAENLRSVIASMIRRREMKTYSVRPDWRSRGFRCCASSPLEALRLAVEHWPRDPRLYRYAQAAGTAEQRFAWGKRFSRAEGSVDVVHMPARG